MTIRATPAARADDDPPLPEAGPRASAKAALTSVYRPHPRKWWMLSGIVLVSLILCASIAAIVTSRERALTQAEQQLQNLAFVLASQANTSFEIIDRVQASLVEQMAAIAIHSPEEFEEKFANLETHLMLKDKNLGLPHVGAFALVDTHGKLFTFARACPIADINMAARRF